MSSPFPPVGRSETLAHQAYQAIRVAIQNDALTPGKFYSENELGQSMGISRTPVREALIELAREGLVEVIPQRGFRLRIPTADEATEVFELRTVLESHVVKRLAEDATDEQLE
jgi:DNA-binding GntR family transcriptional regulator